MEYKLVFSDRKTLSVGVEPDGTVTVKAPRGTSEKYIDELVSSLEPRIEKMKKKASEREFIRRPADEAEEKYLRGLAKKLLSQKVQYFSELLGVAPSGISITGARTRFGSCSGKNRISFSFYLMRYPEKAVDYVVVHELCHIIHHNHSKEFYKEIEKIMPDYKARQKLLKAYTGKDPIQEI